MLAHRQLLDLVEAAFQQAPAIAGGEVQRHRTRPVPAEKDQAVRLRVVRSLPSPLAGTSAPIDWETLLAVQSLARATTGQTPDEAVEPVLVAAHTRLVSTAAATLRAAGFEVDPGPTLGWDEDEAEERIGSLTAIYTVRHRSTYDTLAAA